MTAPTMDERKYAATAVIAQDERYGRSADIDHLLDELATEVAKIRRLQDDVPDWESPETALAVVAAVGRVNRLQGQVAVIVNLITNLQDAAVHQARAHGASWSQIGSRTGEDHRNIRNRYTTRSDG